ncbi:vomeronasal type-1 receptor 4-like [Lepus europaeus]|uniref:vomeronasal type-1 receptor 4-like n=1 Tax=Lepus europaeus TaxID=9983 RepID=UPI002B481354|nr:vomeronasal type-1 receptor 4-like [Lepus europaeus]
MENVTSPGERSLPTALKAMAGGGHRPWTHLSPKPARSHRDTAHLPAALALAADSEAAAVMLSSEDSSISRGENGGCEDSKENSNPTHSSARVAQLDSLPGPQQTAQAQKGVTGQRAGSWLSGAGKGWDVMRRKWAGWGRSQRISDSKTIIGHLELMGWLSDLTMGMIFLLQTITGILGNFSLLSHYLHLHFTGSKFRSTDLIIKHLTVANCLFILFRGVPQTMAALGMKHFLSDIGCKLVFYVHRVSRDVTTGSTCLLCISQAITISPRNPRWAEFKAKVPKYIGLSNILCWMLIMVLNVMVPMYVTGKWNDKNITKKADYGYCYSVISDRLIESGALYAALVLFRDIVFLVLLLWASSFMIFTLYKHRQQVQYIHGTNITSRSSPESRATQSILVLVSTFVSLSTLSSIFHICLVVLNNPSVWLVNTTALVAGSFPAVSPYILMRHDSRVPRLSCAFTGNTGSPT